MILVTGSLAFDHIMDFPGKFNEHIMPDKIHMLNVSFLVQEMRKSFGGTAGNIAYSLSLLGIKCAILSIVGEDFSTYRTFLEKHAIDTSYIKTVNNFYTSTAFGITDNQDNQIWGFYSGADSLTDQLTTRDVAKNIDFGIIAPNNPSAMVKYAREYTQAKIPFLFDPGMQLPWLSAQQLNEAFSGAKIIIGNDYEVSVIEKKLGIGDLHALAQKEKIVITTLGSEGSKISGKGETLLIHAAKVRNTVDPAGAGDAYRAGFMAGFLRGFSLKTCGQMGSIVAAYTVEMFGTTTHSFSIPEFNRRYEENYGELLHVS